VRIVLDTNALVSGLLSPFGPCGEIVRMVSSGELELCSDARILSEYAEVLRRPKFRLDEDKGTALLDYVGFRGHMVASSPLVRSLPDPDDEPFFEVSLAGHAEYLVTGNQVHYPGDLCQGATVVSPRMFLDVYRSRRHRDGWGS
jgi:putative toxin-antitoxin system toxin component, PIN family